MASRMPTKLILALAIFIAVWAMLAAVAFAATPAFSAHKNGTAQTVVGDTATKLTWSTEAFDTNTNFASDRFTPTIAGTYLIVVSVQCAQPGACIPAIYKNGTLYAASRMTNQTFADQSPQATALVSMNGSTDYVEAFATSAGTSISGLATQTYFSGSQVDGSGAGGSSAGAAGYVQLSGGSGAFATSSTTGGQQLFWDSTNHRLGIGTTSPQQALDVSGVIRSGSSSSCSGATALAVRYGVPSEGATTTFGSEYSSCGPVLGYNVKPSTTAMGAFLSSIPANITRGALVIGSTGLKFYTGNLQTVAIDAAATLTEKFTIDLNGNVGIGTTSPSTALEIARNVSGDFPALKLTNTLGSGSVQTGVSIDFYHFNGTLPNAQIKSQEYDAADSGSDIIFSAQPQGGNVTDPLVERMRVSSTGNVGIGDTTPLRLLTIRGNANGTDPTFQGGKSLLRLEGSGSWSEPMIEFAEGDYDPISAIAAKNDGTAAGDLLFLTRPDAGILTERVRILGDSGNVGIGTTSPAAKLTIANNVGDGTLDTYGEYQLLLHDSGTAVSSYGIGMKSSNLVFKTNSAFAFHGSAGTSVATINASGTYAASDRTLKQDIEPINYGLSDVMRMKPSRYRLKEDPTGPHRIGFIAQEMQKVVPEVVIGEEGSMQIAYPSLVPVLTNAIQELKADNDALQEGLKAANDNYENLRREVEALKGAR